MCLLGVQKCYRCTDIREKNRFKTHITCVKLHTLYVYGCDGLRAEFLNHCMEREVSVTCVLCKGFTSMAVSVSFCGRHIHLKMLLSVSSNASCVSIHNMSNL